MLTISDKQTSNHLAEHSDVEIIADCLETTKSLLSKARQLEEKLEALEKRAEGLLENFSIRGFANIYGIELDDEVARELGTRASKLRCKFGVPIRKIPDETFGEVNSYPLKILEQAFDGFNLPFRKPDQL